ncbi:uncharacterized protein P884DRAFT_212156 [Thermothelomyces heterothallicus CBS 202.75]|uniref:uncharacterized protein n=1 Tax=Thermothelomyces heterothallicus CBS 202.75 TaxID=1149848 RepID=UPI003744A9DD
METVFCECKKCDAPIGRLANLWTQIGKGYFSPVIEPEDDLAIQPQGAIRIGGRGTLVDECHLQDLVCTSCNALLGLRCVQTPVNHVLDKNQLLLRLASVELLNSDGKGIKFNIQRILTVNEPSKLNGERFQNPPQESPGGFTSGYPGIRELRQLQLDLHSQREDIRRIDSNGFRIVSALDKRANRIQYEVGKLSDAMLGLQRDIGGLQQDLRTVQDELSKVPTVAHDPNALAALEDRVTLATAAVGRLGEQLAAMDAQFKIETDQIWLELCQHQEVIENLKSTIGSTVPAAEHAQEMANIRAGMAELRQQMNEIRAYETVQTNSAFPFPSRELEVITSSIAKIGNRANQVETLKMELEMLKGRAQFRGNLMPFLACGNEVRPQTSNSSPRDLRPPSNPQAMQIEGIRRRLKSRLYHRVP